MSNPYESTPAAQAAPSPDCFCLVGLGQQAFAPSIAANPSLWTEIPYIDECKKKNTCVRHITGDTFRKLLIRVPVITGINDSIEEMHFIKDFLDKHGKFEKIELLPYHAMGENKYAAIEKEAQRFTPPDNDMLNKLKAVF